MDKWDLLLKAELQNKTVNLNEFVSRCCHGLNVSTQYVIDNLLSLEDRQDIINGDIPAECARAIIKAWIDLGMPHFATCGNKL